MPTDLSVELKPPRFGIHHYALFGRRELKDVLDVINHDGEALRVVRVVRVVTVVTVLRVVIVVIVVIVAIVMSVDGPLVDGPLPFRMSASGELLIVKSPVSTR